MNDILKRFIILIHFHKYYIFYNIYLATLMLPLCYLYLKGLIQNAFTHIYYYFILIRRNRQNKHDLFGKQQYIFFNQAYRRRKE